MFSYPDIADALETGLRSESDRLDAEHAVYGLDACDELELHPRLADVLSAAGFGVHREKRYPGDRRKRRETEGERCDLVLTHDARALQTPEAAPTLFAEPDAVSLDEALWLEVKVAHQFTIEGANGSYASQVLSTVHQDVRKLSKDDGILHAALLLVLFVRDEHVAEHDLKVWQGRCLERGLPIGASYRRNVTLRDRLGNGACALALTPVHHI